MKIPYTFSKLSCSPKRSLNSITLFFFCVLILACNRTYTKEDVEAQANGAKKELQKAREEVKKAFEVKHDYIQQEQQKLIDRLEARLKDLNDELSRLRSVADQSGEIAISDVNAAIKKVEVEKNRVEQQIAEVNNIKIIRWEDVGRGINESVASIESALDQMADDLKIMDVLIQTYSDTTAVQ